MKTAGYNFGKSPTPYFANKFAEWFCTPLCIVLPLDSDDMLGLIHAITGKGGSRYLRSSFIHLPHAVSSFWLTIANPAFWYLPKRSKSRACI